MVILMLKHQNSLKSYLKYSYILSLILLIISEMVNLIINYCIESMLKMYIVNWVSFDNQFLFNYILIINDFICVYS